MSETSSHAPPTAVVVGASGQDGYYLTERLLAEGFEVHATTRRPATLDALARAGASAGRLRVHAVELTEPAPLFDLIARERPAEVYNLAGQSSVSRSFSEPLRTWETNADFIAGLLEALRLRSPRTRFYQASSTDMFGAAGSGTIRYDESSALNPQSPYASAKAAAHLLCRSYREAYDLRVACGILSNHESRRRPAPFLSRKIVDHVRALRSLAPAARRAQPPLRMGNLKIRRDWGFAPDYVEGMQLVIRQIEVRAARADAPTRRESTVTPAGGAAADSDARDGGGASYRDYVLGTGRTHAVWELVDAAFRLGGFPLEWELEGDEAARWGARFKATGDEAVVVDEKLLRPADPLVIEVDAARARRELGWSPRAGLEVFLADMLDDTPERADAAAETRDDPLLARADRRLYR
jgi:GDPmannose 4,6-dehydratase